MRGKRMITNLNPAEGRSSRRRPGGTADGGRHYDELLSVACGIAPGVSRTIEEMIEAIQYGAAFMCI